jgi:cytochrome oxidase assembly protein ShyY1
MDARYRFALRPGWLLSHVFVVALVVLMVSLGFWQLRRLDERRALNDRVEANASAEPVALAELLPAGSVPSDDVVWRPVTVEGNYREGADVLVANRAIEGQPGFWVVTPFEPADGSAPVAVVRGFVTRAAVDQSEPTAFAPQATDDEAVRVTGYAQRSRGGGRFARDLPDGALPQVTTVDLDALGEQWGAELAPVWLQRRDEVPTTDDAGLLPVPLPARGDGPHLGYAAQWFIFSLIAIVGYPLILRRNARARMTPAG